MRASGLLLCSALLLQAAEARAYVCSRVTGSDGEDGAALSWFTREVTFTIYQSGTSDIASPTEQQVLRESFDVWADLVVGSDSTCSAGGGTDFEFIAVTTPSQVDRVGYDFGNPSANENVMLFRDEDWPHGAKIIALTTTTYSPLTGQILDADIEFNSEGFDFTSGDSSVSTDLKNTSVHEIGHLLGLAHTPVRAATMYAEAGEGEVKKRDLACDDLDAMVFKYPAAQPNRYCDPPGDTCGRCAPPGELTRRPLVVVGDAASDGKLGGCASSTPVTLGGLLAALALLRLARRRTSR